MFHGNGGFVLEHFANYSGASRPLACKQHPSVVALYFNATPTCCTQLSMLIPHEHNSKSQAEMQFYLILPLPLSDGELTSEERRVIVVILETASLAQCSLAAGDKLVTNGCRR